MERIWGARSLAPLYERCGFACALAFGRAEDFISPAIPALKCRAIYTPSLWDCTFANKAQK